MADGREKYIISTEFDGKGVNDAEKGFKKVEKTAVESGNKMDATLKKVGAAVGGYFAYQQIEQFASAIVNARKEIEKYEVSFRTLLGDKQKADEFFGEIRSFAVQTPLLLKDLAGGAQTMLGFNIEAEKVIPTLKQIGDISMGDAQKFQSLTLAFSQMSATGKLMGQDLLQMINAGFNPLSEISRTTGKSITQLKEEMSDGAISAEMVARAFESATSEGGQFNGMLEAQSKTIEGAMSNLQGAFEDALNELGKSAQPLITTTVEGLTGIVGHLDEVGKALVVLIATVGTYKAATLVAAIATDGLTTALKAAKIAQAAFNVVANANPYVLLATAVIGVVTALVTFADATSDAEKATNSLKKEQEDYTNKIEEERKQIEELIAVIQNESKSEQERNEALQKLKEMYPSIFGQYSTATELLHNLTTAQQQYNDALREQMQLQGKKSYESNKGLLEKVRKFNENRKKSENWARLQFDNSLTKDEIEIIKSTGLNRYSSDLAGVLEQKVNIQDRQRANDAQSSYLASVVNKSNSELEKDASRWTKLLRQLTIEESETARNYITTEEGIILSKEQITKRWIAATNQLDQNKKNASRNLYSESKKNYDDAVKEQKRLEELSKSGWSAEFANKEAFDKALTDARAKVKSAKESYEGYGGDTSTKKGKKDTEEEKKLKQQAELTEEEYKQDVQRKNDKIKNELELRQLILDAQKETSVKRIAQIKLDYDKENEAIRLREEEIYEQKYQAAKKQWELVNKSPFTGTRAEYRTLTDDESALLDQQKKTNQAKLEQSLEVEHAAEKKAMDDYLIEYGNLQEKKLAIASKYAKLIADAEYEGDKLALRKQEQSEIQKAELDAVKKNPKFALAFSDPNNASVQTLRELIKDFEAQMKNGALNNELDPNDLQAWADAAQSMFSNLVERDPFAALKESARQLKDSESALVKANAEYVSALTKGEKIVKKYRIENGKVVAEYYTLEELEKAVADAEAEAAKARTNYTKSINAACEKVDELASAIKNLGDEIGGTEGEILSCIAQTMSFATQTIQGIQQLSTIAASSITATMKAIESASVILAIVGAAIQLMQALSTLVKDEHEVYEKLAEKQAAINDLRDSVNDYAIAVEEANKKELEWFGTTRMASLKNQWKVSQEAADAYYQKLHESQAKYVDETSSGWLTKAWDAVTTGVNWINSLPTKTIQKIGDLVGIDSDNEIGKAIADWSAKLTDPLTNAVNAGLKAGIKEGAENAQAMVSAIENLRIETKAKSSGFLGTGIGGHAQETMDLRQWVKEKYGKDKELFDEKGMINLSLADTILDDYGDKLVGETKKTIEKLKELKEKYDEYTEQLKEVVSELYSPLADNLTDALWEWYKEGTDVMDKFREYASDTFETIAKDAIKTAVFKKLFDGYSDELTKIYDEYVQSQGGISEEELMSQVAEVTKGLTSNIEAAVPTLQAMTESVGNALKEAGYGGKDSEITASQKSVASMSEETASELNGRFTALQISGEAIQQYAMSIAESISNIASITTKFDTTNGLLEDINQNILACNGTLNSIYDANIKGFNSMRQAIDAVTSAVNNKL